MSDVPTTQRSQGQGTEYTEEEMCGRYTLTSVGQLPLRFGVAEAPLEPRYNLAPTQLAPVLIAGTDQPELQLLRWGFRRASRAENAAPAPINARAETIAGQPYFRGALARHRCLVPADGFYEWQAVPGSKSRQPYRIMRDDGDLFAFAGIYTPAGAQEPGTFAIITVPPNTLVAPIHNRMPAILRPEEEALWLDPDLTDVVTAQHLLQPYPAEWMRAYPVSSRVSNARNEGPELIQPVEGGVTRQLGDADDSH